MKELYFWEIHEEIRQLQYKTDSGKGGNLKTIFSQIPVILVDSNRIIYTGTVFYKSEWMFVDVN